MCDPGDRDPNCPTPSDKRSELDALVARLHDAQQAATQRIERAATFETLGYTTPDGWTVQDTLRMWVWHFWTHQRDLVRARGPLANDDPHFHVPHFIRQAHEEFGRFVGELACLSDEWLDVRPPEGGRTVRETVEHVLDTLDSYLGEQIEQARPPSDAPARDEA
jgi:uncharacterized damage-inducible protein DinB